MSVVDLVLNISSNALHMSTTSASANGSQAPKTGDGHQRKQWKNLDLASGQTVAEHREQPSTTGRKVYKYGPSNISNIKIPKIC
jgi:hypothetical protein